MTSAEAVSSPKIAWQKLLPWGPAIASLIGASAFVVMAISRTGLAWFYGHFDVSPEDVGLDRSTVVFQTAGAGLAAVFGAGGLGLGTGLIASRLFAGTTSEGAQRPLPDRLVEPVFLRTAATVALTAMAAYFAWGLMVASQSLDRVRRGESADRQMVAHGEVFATCVEVWWLDDAGPPPFGTPATRRLVLLGRAQGVDIYFDPSERRTLRVPSDRVLSRTCGGRD